MNSILMSLVAFFLIQPVEEAITARLEQMQAPQAIVEKVAACSRQAVPAAVDRVTSDPAWAVTTLVTVWLGQTDSQTILVDIAPDCEQALDAARPFLSDGGA